jgi:hypothetical protein
VVTVIPVVLLILLQVSLKLVVGGAFDCRVRPVALVVVCDCWLAMVQVKPQEPVVLR